MELRGAIPMPDHVIIIGAGPRRVAAFGPHHLGLTGGAKTGRLVADLVIRRSPIIDLDPDAPQRFDP